MQPHGSSTPPATGAPPAGLPQALSCTPGTRPDHFQLARTLTTWLGEKADCRLSCNFASPQHSQWHVPEGSCGHYCRLMLPAQAHSTPNQCAPAGNLVKACTGHQLVKANGPCCCMRETCVQRPDTERGASPDQDSGAPAAAGPVGARARHACCSTRGGRCCEPLAFRGEPANLYARHAEQRQTAWGRLWRSCLLYQSGDVMRTLYAALGSTSTH